METKRVIDARGLFATRKAFWVDKGANTGNLFLADVKFAWSFFGMNEIFKIWLSEHDEFYGRLLNTRVYSNGVVKLEFGNIFDVRTA